jgi:hypothetical protein
MIKRMALLFQSNPDVWDLREYFDPGKTNSWFVNRHYDYMKPDVICLFWIAKGSKKPGVKGLYGWGVTDSELKPDQNGFLRIQLLYIERWVNAFDVTNNTLPKLQTAGIPGKKILSEKEWEGHVLNKMAIGTNFLVELTQLDQLSKIVEVNFPDSNFPSAVKLFCEGEVITKDMYKFQTVNQKSNE